tara:strand:+ start:1963 stop:2637 length:675 start_codon:yes stop_codon:yes gene_type:complete
MYDVTLYGHLTVDRVLTGFEMDNTLGSMANVWKQLITINPTLKISLQPTVIGEALIYVDKDKSERCSAVNLNMKTNEPVIQDCRWNHVLYINKLPNTDFLKSLKWGVTSADICRGEKLKDLSILKNIDILFLSDEDNFYDMEELQSYVKKYIILHSKSGSDIYYKSGAILNTKVEVIENVNVLGCGDMLAANFINYYLQTGDPKTSIENAHTELTEYLRSSNEI